MTRIVTTFAPLAAAILVAACTNATHSKTGAGNGAAGPGGGDDGSGIAGGGDPGSDPGSVGSGGAGDTDGGGGGGGDAAVDPGPPAPQYIGRFDTSDPAGPRAAYPGVRAVVRFDGTAVSVRLSQTNGFSGGPSWFDVFVDGAPGTPFSVAGAAEEHVLATGLPAGTHVVEIAKRTESKLGSVRFEGFTFPGGGKLLSPPARAARRIEFLGDSTIDGFGVEGNVATTCAGGDPPQFDDAQKSVAYFTAQATNAEHFLLAVSGKGITKNEDPSDTEHYPSLYGRTLPQDPSSTWSWSSWTPDAVVISLGGTDFDGATQAPSGFVTAYGGLVDSVRSHYPSAHVYMTVWSQIKDTMRAAMQAALNQVVAARSGDTKLHVFLFSQASYENDETGCYYHANAAHHQAMANELAAKLKSDLGW